MLLEELSNAFGPSGCEGEVRDLIKDAIKDVVDECHVDHLGNLLAVRRGTQRGPRMRIMVAAHMDEVGFMISHADADGFLHVVKVGGIDDRVLPAKRLVIGPNRVKGVLISPPVHVVPAEQRNKPTPCKDLVVDIGAGKKDAAEAECKKGDYATFDTHYQKLGRGLVCGKALDDRVGCAVLVELLKRGPFPFDLHAAFTTMEEVGVRGARVAGYDSKPHVAFVLEGTVCEDSPCERDQSPVTRLGKGPAVTLADRGVIVNRKLAQYALQRAEARGIPCQIKQPGVGGNDAAAIQHAEDGVSALPISVPVRYLHSPASVMSLSDMSHTIDLIEDLVREMTPKVVKA
ncbi:MAG: M42 family peptidase [Verrucomicrobia bacterium]|jgi:tetrahedral aminopeptidase|nr:M42 family peptidase [Verrucomicrobiota bacterium]